ncbi:hypothetical protein [Aquimarina aggregata]|uniref:hypothetical protein n=1 Tax=Aquimarina aggregata TaxID=1642818 RepID=UPI0012FD5FCB|nr:hypothetical protein [Aquimarina aggregata]
MKKLLYIPVLLIFILIFSCGQNSAEKKLNGKWYETENKKIIWQFYRESLVFIDDNNDKVEWTATESKIEFDYPTFYWDSLSKPVDIIDKIVIDYKLTDNNDSLSGTLTNRYGKHKFGLIRIEEE